jgi:putative transcriptional regulator
MSKNFISARTTKDGRVIQMMADGREIDITPQPRTLSSEPAPDDAGMSPEQLAQLKPVPRSKSLRRALALTQEEFSERYRIPLGTLRDWEQGRSEPDAPSRAYLKVIAKNPEMVRLALVS